MNIITHLDNHLQWPPLVRLESTTLPRLNSDALPSWAGDFASDGDVADLAQKWGVNAA